jgi:Tol biopolymer transport system component
MAAQTTTQAIGRRGKRRSVALVSLALGAALAGVVAMGGTARQADAVFAEKVVFVSDRTTGVGGNNPTGDKEIFRMNLDGTGVRQLTFNKVDDFGPILSPDGTRVVYASHGVQPSNPEGDWEVYAMNASDGKGKKNLSNNRADVEDYDPVFSPGGKRIAYTTYGKQDSNSEGDPEVYVVNALDGTGNKNLTDNGVEVSGAYPVGDFDPDFSPDGKRIAYLSESKQPSNQQGDSEVYVMNALDGTGQKNLTDTTDSIHDIHPDVSPDGGKVAYTSQGDQISNQEGDGDIYVMNATDGLGRKNLTNNGPGVVDDYPRFSPGGKKITYQSYGEQDSNLQGDPEVYRLNALDGADQVNLTNNGTGVSDHYPYFSRDGTKVFYESVGMQSSNLQGDKEIYRLNTSDGKGKRNLTDNDAFDEIYPD